MKANIIWKTVSTILSIAGIIALFLSWKTFGPFVKAAWSVKQLNEHFYFMEFKGDSQLEDYLAHGGASSNQEMAVFIESLLRGKRINRVFKDKVPLNTGCASISCRTPDGKKVFGRNYDWNEDQFGFGLIIKSTPKHGYKSVSTLQFDFLGFGEGFKPDSFGNKYLMTAALFVPLDGMNEKGLCISDLMAGDYEETAQDTGKSAVTTTLAIRGVLDLCADVPEALEFLKTHDMHSVVGRAHHFAISDRTGRAVVVEFIDNEMIVTEADTLTNHYLAVERDVITLENSTMRRAKLNECLEQKGALSETDVKEAIAGIRASQYGNSKTWWSAVFNQDDLSVRYYLEENYDEAASFVCTL